MKESNKPAATSKNAATISMSEFMRIKGSVNIATNDDNEAKKMERKTMHEIAQSKVKIGQIPSILSGRRKKMRKLRSSGMRKFKGEKLTPERRPISTNFEGPPSKNQTKCCACSKIK